MTGMKIIPFIAVYTLISLRTAAISAQDSIRTVSDTISFTGQVSGWSGYNFRNNLPLQAGGRYIPTLYYGIHLPDTRKIDFEGSLNISGTLYSHPFDTLNTSGNLSPYRALARFTTSQLEIRAGLQKINFGSATLLRPLMWFDQIDPRDPLQLTNGVWGVLGRYYFLNNTNIWLWSLLGNDKPRPWDIGTTNRWIPEFGGRFQQPFPKSEIAISYHHRSVNMNMPGFLSDAYARVPENRIGIDGKWNLGFGIWFEGTWINKSKNTGSFTNQEILNIGADNDFSLGNGLHITFEQLLAGNGKRPFQFTDKLFFSGISLNYPLTLNDNLSAIIFYDWENIASYNFINWNHNFKNIALYLMAYLNPDKYNLPQQSSAATFYAGPGVQVMLVYNY